LFRGVNYNAVNAVIASAYVFRPSQTNIEFSSYPTAQCKKCNMLK